MKPTEKLEKEILRVYNAYWDSYLKGDMDRFADLLDEHCHIIGSTAFDVFNDRQSAVAFYTTTGEQISGKAELRNRKITVLPAGNNVMVQEQADFYFLADSDWHFYGYMRLSTLLAKKETGWKIIHQHGSMPDARTQEGEQVALDKISKENLELRDAVKRRTVELESKNRELEIESALERVRTVATGMNKPDDMLHVCRIISEQLEVLKVKEIRNVQTAIFYEDKGTYMNYEYYAKHSKTFITETTYTNNEIHEAFADKMLKGNGGFHITHIKGDEVKDWIAYQKTTNVFIDDYLYTASSLNYYWFSPGPVALGISTYVPLTDDETNLFRRFLKVFELSYRRYLDIEKAEAQAREAQIELSLERIRAKTMAMHNSQDVGDTVAVMFDELVKLGIDKTIRCGIAITDGTKHMEIWTASSNTNGEVGLDIGRIDSTIHPLLRGFHNAWKNKEAEYTYELLGEDLKDYFRAINASPDYPIQFDISSLPSKQVHSSFFFPEGALFAFSPEPLTIEISKIFKKVAGVFGQTYRRYLDLQKAEAQAREAQIETALERVRSRTMGMQKSDELREVIKIVYQQLHHLKINLGHAGFVVDYKPGGDWHFWIADEQDIPAKITHPYFESVWANQFNEAKEAGADSFATHLNFEEKNKFYNKLLTYVPGLPQASKDFYLSCPGLAGFTVLFDNVSLYMENFSGIPYTEEENIMLMRFGKVFQQTYTRFLDLQKAEAQARESQIQLALERVRARTMAMHQSTELADTSLLVFRQLHELGLVFWRTGFYIWKKEEGLVQAWTSNGELTGLLPPISFPFKEDEGHSGIYEASLHGEYIYEKYLDGEALDKHYDWLLAHSYNSKSVSQLKEEGLDLPTRQYKYAAIFKQGYLMVIATEPQPDTNNLLVRFANVFEQAYTRFLDLQKAEAQARESQIQLALERVRARTMAMQRSDELPDAALLLSNQVKELGVQLRGVSFQLWDDDRKEITAWSCINNIMMPSFKIPATEDPLYKNILEVGQKGEGLYVQEFGGEALENHNQYMSSIPSFNKALSSVGLDHSPATSLILHAAYFSNGFILIITLDPCPGSHEIFKRFAKVFEQTYTRFLDLQKVEAQARDAQIEAALERVRSRTMAMHNSEDVGETVATLFDELVKLGVHTNRCGILINSKDRMQSEVWTAKSNPSGKATLIIGQLDLTMHPLLTGIYHAWKNKEPVFIYAMLGDDLRSYYSAINNSKYYPTLFDLETLPAKEFHTDFYFDEGSIFAFTPALITDEAASIFERFAKVFGQTYRRYLDLKKAEAQTREAKIEAAMEKVRSRAMAMQKPHELVEVAQLLRKEMNGLGVEELETSSIYIIHEDGRETECWYAIKDVTHIEKELVADHMAIHLNDTWVGKQMLAFYRSDQKQVSINMQGNNRKEWINYCADHSSVLLGYYGDSIPDRVYHLYKFSNGYMGAASPGDISAESWDLLQRATAVFSLAYTRFSDLQQAEAQAREAQVEVALERVRSRTLAMQKSDELAETAAVLFRQLIHLGIAPHRLYIGIIKDETGDCEFWVTYEDGNKISTAFKTNLHDNPSFFKMLEGWKANKKSISIDMQGAELDAYFKHLVKLGVPFQDGLMQKRRLQNITYFGKGFIGMASSEEQGEAAVSLLERFAAVFNLTYTRFNDLQVAEAHAIHAAEDLLKLQTEKKRAEDALTELRETQKQLIQSEKMASLGELTAGIAHEIQNPLNFVNNFSEVNTELIEELKGERHKAAGLRNTQLEDELIGDIKQNMEKIAHHGKRADAIVKGMLQHSRATGIVKEPTDINALADEYIRLCYHGLRAKDKLFNAAINTDFDTSVEKINIIPQDIGRVVLNIMTNAFYAVNARKKMNAGGYEPAVSVQTKKDNDKVELSIADNGAGIPQNIIDKIFQPFFTTKPTGQGTGLGLSLCYDIIKAHDGEIKVITKAGEGSTFIIQLPIV